MTIVCLDCCTAFSIFGEGIHNAFSLLKFVTESFMIQAFLFFLESCILQYKAFGQIERGALPRGTQNNPDAESDVDVRACS
jgi:hypothetical protein